MVLPNFEYCDVVWQGRQLFIYHSNFPPLVRIIGWVGQRRYSYERIRLGYGSLSEVNYSTVLLF